MSAYTSPFSTRYASPEMSHLFSSEFRIIAYRRLWIALAKAQRKLGLPISSEQIAEMESKINQIDHAQIHFYEKRFRHDVMAHIHAFGDLCPLAKPVLHLGATSCYVTDNADLIQCKAALPILIGKLTRLILSLRNLAKEYRNAPCLGYTHFQPAQPTTIGKRVSLWLQDFLFDIQDLERLEKTLPFLGAKGATGTQASFLTLFESDEKKVVELETLIAQDFGFTHVLPISGQTYTRKIDLNLLNAFASFAASAHKMGTDLRLLAHEGEMVESFDESQIGSSAMPYKRNPIYAERVCALARFVISLAQNPIYTLATQWLERSLDDSANRRLAIPEAFLGMDALLNVLLHLVEHLQPMREIALQKLQVAIPMLSMENILMLAVKKGGDRQALHEKLRRHLHTQSLEEFIAFIVNDPSFHLSIQEIEPLLNISSLIGRAPKQVEEFLKQEASLFSHLEKRPMPPLFHVEI